MPKKPRPDAKLKSGLSPEQQERLYEYLRNHSIAEGVAFCAGEFGVETSTKAVSDFNAWYFVNALGATLKRITAEARKLVAGDIDPKAIYQAGMSGFMAKALEENDPKLFRSMAALFRADAKLAHEIEKFQAAISDKLDAALSALSEEIDGNPEAQRLFAELRAAIARGPSKDPEPATKQAA